MRFLFRVVFFLMLVGVLCGSASADAYATYDPDGWGGEPYLRLYGGEMNASYLATHIKHVDNSTYMAEHDVFIPYEDGYMFNNIRRIQYNTGWYNHSDKTTYYQRADGSLTLSTEHDLGPFNFSNSTIKCVYPTRVSFASAIKPGINITNSRFNDIKYFGVYSLPYHNEKNFEMSNVIFINGDMGPKIEGTVGMVGGILHDIHFQDMEGRFLEIGNATNTVIYNITAEGAIPDNVDATTGVYFAGAVTSGLYETNTGGHDNQAWNISLNGTGRSGFALSGHEYNFTGCDIEVNYSGHNGIDLHSGFNVTLTNVIIRHSLMENFMITGPVECVSNIHTRTYPTGRNITVPSHDIYIYNLYTENATGSDLSWNNFVNVWLENAITYNSKKFGNINKGENLTIINASGSTVNDPYAFALGATSVGVDGYLNDTKLIDCNFSGDGYDPAAYLVWALNTSIINSYFEGGVILHPENQNDYTEYYYPNIVVKDISGNPVDNAVLTTNTTARNGYGVVQERFVTDKNGRLYDSGNRSNWMAIPNMFKNTTSETTYISEITATKSGQSDYKIFDPDNTWYSPNPAILSGPEIILTLNIEEETMPSTLAQIYWWLRSFLWW